MIATLVGCAIGDALGVPFEMKAASYIARQEWDGKFRDGGTFRKENKAGQYSDDTIASMCLTESLLECKGFDPENTAGKYLDWLKSGNYRGMGSTTNHALARLKLGATWKTSGLEGDEFGGNGTAMRVAPIGIFYRNNLEKMVESAILDATITHNSREPKAGSVAIAAATAYLCPREGEKRTTLEALDYAITVVEQLGKSVVLEKMKLARQMKDWDGLTTDYLQKIGVRGYVPETVGAAFVCLTQTNNFKEAIETAVRAGGDCDTTAAIVGAMAGTFYGLEGIPEEFHMVEDFEKLKELDTKLWQANE